MPEIGTELCGQDRITTGERSRVEFRLSERDTTTGTSSNSITVIPSSREECVRLEQGLLAFISSVIGGHCVSTPLIDGGIDGTEALVAVEPDGSSFVLVREGIVTVQDRRDGARIELAAIPGETVPAAFATPGQAVSRATEANTPGSFRGLLLDPKAATDWAVYYPPILLARDAKNPTEAEAARLLQSGDPTAAETLLRGSGTGPALALLAVADIARNRAETGLSLAEQSVDADPDLAAGHVALSYARQSLGALEAARDSARTATERQPGDAFAWARLAELELTLGHRRAARRAVERSLGIAETGLARTIEGFVALSSNRFDAAGDALTRAVQLDSKAPLARLGLGLLAIRRGNLQIGRQEIETAVALDPRRAATRVWLGRAYVGEGDNDKAGNQFALAQERDPDDPNAWLFDALRLFTANRPVEALRAAETAREVSPNRSVLRSDKGLGEDLAVQSSAIGRIYDVLGFESLFRITGAEAVDADPTNPEAHRLLADAARTDPGGEITQVSERLKATLLEGPSKTPIQPQLGEIDLALIETSGPARVTFSEYAPLFDQNGLRADLSGFLGSEETFGYEASVTGLHDWASFGFGSFLFDTDGFGANNDLRHEIQTAQLKVQPIPELTLFGELSRLETVGGDRLTPFLADGDRDSDLRIETINSQFRFGAHFKPGPNLSIFGYFEGAALERSFSDIEFVPIPPLGGPQLAVFRGDEDGYKAEFAGAARLDDISLQFGAEHAQTEFDDIEDLGFTTTSDDNSSELTRIYGSADLELPSGFFWSAGFAFERYEDTTLSESSDRVVAELQPKLGLRVRPLKGLQLRAAYTESLARPSIFPETLERTSFGGFDQFFEGTPGSEFRVLSGGIDVGPFHGFRAGVSARSIKIDLPRLDAGDFETDRLLVSGYLSATISDRFAISIEPEFLRERSDALLDIDALETWTVPLTASYFDPNGFFATTKITYFRQRGNDQEGAGTVSFSENGFIFDAALGYRFLSGRAALSLEAFNLTDQQVDIRDRVQAFGNATLQDSLLASPLVQPGRSVLATVTVRF